MATTVHNGLYGYIRVVGAGRKNGGLKVVAHSSIFRSLFPAKYETRETINMQNKPNFRKSQMNATSFSRTAYENKSNWTLGENKPNQTQLPCPFSAVPGIEQSRRVRRATLVGEVPSALNPPAGCPFHPRCSLRRSDCSKQIPVLKRGKGACEEHLVACWKC